MLLLLFRNLRSPGALARSAPDARQSSGRIGGGLALARVLDGFLFGLEAFNATAFAAACVLPLGVGLASLLRYE